jgi:hypothetical protein
MGSAAAVQGLVMEVVVDTRAVMSIRGTELCGLPGCKPYIKNQVSLIQAGSDDQLRGFLAGPCRRIYIVWICTWRLFLGLYFLQGQKVILDLVHSTLSVGGETTRTVQKELVDTVIIISEIKDDTNTATFAQRFVGVIGYTRE